MIPMRNPLRGAGLGVGDNPHLLPYEVSRTNQSLIPPEFSLRSRGAYLQSMRERSCWQERMRDLKTALLEGLQSAWRAASLHPHSWPYFVLILPSLYNLTPPQTSKPCALRAFHTQDREE